MKILNAKRISLRHLALVIVLAGVACLGLSALRGKAASTPSKPATNRLLVKINASLAKTAEAALPLQTMELVAGQTGSSQIDQFLLSHSTRRAWPLYTNIVRWKKQSGFTDLQIASAVRSRFARRSNRFHASFQPPEISRTYVFELDPAAIPDFAAVLRNLQSDPAVEFAEEDKLVSTTFFPNDPYFSSSGSWGQAYDDLWGIKKIGSPTAWDTSTGAGVIVAVVDTGVDLTHPDIAANIWTNPGEIPGNGIDDDGNGYIDDVHGWDFIGSTYTSPTQSNNPIDHFGHGTHVAGTIAAAGNNGIGVIGVAWNAQVMPVKGLDDQGSGLDSTLAPAILYAANNGADVISNSWSGVGTSKTIADAMSYAYNLGAVVVAAAGNNADDARNYYPANLPTVITVAATDPTDVLAYFSNFGSKIDVAAPGVDILSLRAAGTSMGTPVDAYYTRASGTSMATPHVSGLAALILSQHPDYSNEDVRQVLRISAADLGAAGFDLTYGYGRINAANAITVPGVLEAKILSPIDGTSVSSPVTISGYARGNNFGQYTLSYGVGSTPATWATLASGTNPVAGGTLGVFDPTVLSNGLYTIRLTSYDTSNNAFVDQIELLNDTVSITSPLPSIVPSTAVEFKPGQVIPVTGTAQGGGFQDFRLDWAEGINPSTGWSTAGIVVAGSGSAPVISGSLGSWDTSSITKSDFYTLRLSVDNSSFTNILTTLVYLDTQLQSAGWPQAVNQTPYLSVGVVPGSDGQGHQRLATVAPSYSNSNAPAQFWSFAPNGGAPNTVVLNYGEFFQPASGTFYGASGDQFLVGDGLNLNVFQPDSSFSTFSTGLPITFQFSQIVLADLNNNSQLEAAALGSEFANNTAYLYAWQKDGTQLSSNFPIAIPDQNLSLTEARTGPRVLIGDINGDGNKEIIVQAGPSSSTTSLLLFAHDGTPMSWSAPAFTGYATQMALADLDHNGKLETILMVFTGSQEVLHVLQPDGTERAGWPLVLGSPDFESYVAVGDLNRTGHEQLVVSNLNNLYVLNADGTPLSSAWPILNVSGTVFGPPVLADIDGGGKPEIVLTRIDQVSFPGPLNPGTTSATSLTSAQIATSLARNSASNTDGATASLPTSKTAANVQSGSSSFYSQLRLTAFRPDSSTVSTWNLFGAGGLATGTTGVVTVGDFANSGTTKIAVVYALAPVGGGFDAGGVVTVLDTGAPYHAAANDWPMIFHDAHNSAVRSPDLIPPSLAITYPASGATVGGQITVTANANDNVGVASVQFHLDGANLGAPATAAPYAVVWDTTQSSAGNHTLTAVAFDGAGNSTVSSPVAVTVSQLANLSVTPSSLSFGGQLLNTTSASQAVTVTNASTLPATITGVSATGDFAQTTNCVTTLAPGGSCTISVTYTPTVRGPANGNLTIGGTFGGASPVVALSGTGQVLLSTISPPSMSFPPQLVGTTSSVQTFNYSNSGDLPVSISAVSINGDFAQTNVCPATLAVGSSCTINVTFTPAVRGNRSGTLTISGNASASATISGTGQASSVSITPASLDFGNQLVNTTSAAQNVTINNNGDFSFYISSWSYGSPFTATNNCPFPINPGTSCTFSVTFAPTSFGTTTRTLSISGSFPGSPAAIALSGTGQDTAASLSTTSLSFGNQLLNTTSGPQSLFLFNTANSPVTISSIQATGDFAQTNNCGSTLAVSASCTITVTFTPTLTGARSGSLTINSNTRVPIPSVSLSGTGTAPAPSFNPVSLTYAAQRVNTTSAAQAVTLSNSGTASLSISSFSVVGDFAQTNNCGTTLASGGSCAINVSFTPSARGTRSGTLTLNSNASSTAPTVTLSGTGVASIATPSPSSLAFANQLVATPSAAQTVTLTNSGDATLNLTSINAGGDFAESNTCGTTLAAGGSCSINVTFTPTVTGSRSANLTIADDALGGSPQTVGLSGTGVAPVASFSPTGFTSFGGQLVNTTSATQALTLTNTGTATLSITGFTVTANFTQTNTCGTGLAVGSSCSVSVAFAPTAQGNLTGTLTLNSNLPGPAPSFTLSGTGTAPALSFSPATFSSFGNQFVNTTSAPQTMNITNNGNAALSIASFPVTAGFGQTNTCGTSLGINATCSVSVTFTPGTQGSVTGTLTLNSNLPGAAPSFSLSGTGAAPALSFSPATFNSFGNQRVNTTSAPQTMTITNNGDAALSITSFTVTAGFGQTNTCGTSLGINATCSVSVTFIPGTQGSATGTLTLNSNLPGAAPSFSLSGTGTASAATLSATSLTFASQIVGTTSAAQQVTLTNSGTASLNISSISASGDFAQTNNCPSSLGSGTNCTVSVTFIPKASGNRAGTLSIADDAVAGSPQTVSLNGTSYTVNPQFNVSSLTFASQRVGTTSAGQNVTLSNTGSGPLSISGFVLAADFGQTNNCPASLGAGGTCTISVTFQPTARGIRSGTLTLSSNAPETPPSVSLSGAGIGPVASLSPSSLTFAPQTVSTTSSSQNVTLSNTGDATLDISNVTASGNFAETNNCATTLSAGAHCTVSVTFTPTAAGALTGTLTVADDASNGSPQTTSLSGTGADFSLGASPSSVTVTHGNSVNVVVTVSALGGSFNSNVNLACSAGLPKGANCSFSPGGVTPGSSSATSTMKISTNGSTPVGSYVLTVRGTTGSLAHTTQLVLNVN